MSRDVIFWACVAGMVLGALLGIRGVIAGVKARVALSPRYARVALFGHRVVEGEIREVRFCGAPFLRVVAIGFDGEYQFPELIGPRAIFSLEEIDAEEVEKLRASRRDRAKPTVAIPRSGAVTYEDDIPF